MENLVLHYPCTVLLFAGLISMVATGCAIQAGDALYKRFQRAQLKQQLGKLKWTPLVALCLSFSLLTSQLAFGQAPTPPKRLGHYETLFQLVNGLTVQTRKFCKTEACAKAADELATVIADGKEKHSKGLLVDETRKQFHADFRTSMTKLHIVLVDNLSEKDKAAMKKLPECPTCNKVPAVRPVQEVDQERCHLCWDVLEVSSEICALYLGTCNTCALICLSTAALAFGNCIERWCYSPDPYYNNN